MFGAIYTHLLMAFGAHWAQGALWFAIWFARLAESGKINSCRFADNNVKGYLVSKGIS